MKRFKAVIILFVFLALISGASAQETKGFNGMILIGGSTTLFPVMADKGVNYEKNAGCFVFIYL